MLYHGLNAAVSVAMAVLGATLVLNVLGFGHRWVQEPPYVEVRRLSEMRQENAERSFERVAEREAMRLFPPATPTERE